MRPRTVVCVVAALTLLVGACGQSDEDGGADSAGDTSGAGAELRDPEVVAEQALALFDADFAATSVALLAAADRGYSPTQIVVAVEGGTLTAAGGVVVDGEVVDPDREAQDFITDKPSVEGDAEGEQSLGGHSVELVAFAVPAQDTDGEPVTLDDLKRAFEGDVLAAMSEAVPGDTSPSSGSDGSDDELRRRATHVRTIGTIEVLLAQGYSAEQIILAFVGGLVRFDELDVEIEGEFPDFRRERLFDVDSAASAPEADAGTSVDDYNGTYIGSEPIDHGASAIIDVLSTEVTISVEAGTFTGTIVERSLVDTSNNTQERVEEAIQTVEFSGAVNDAGEIDGTGTTRLIYVLQSCTPAEACQSAEATLTPAGTVEISVSGSIEGNQIEVVMANSVSSSESSVQATRD